MVDGPDGTLEASPEVLHRVGMGLKAVLFRPGVFLGGMVGAMVAELQERPVVGVAAVRAQGAAGLQDGFHQRGQRGLLHVGHGDEEGLAGRSLDDSQQDLLRVAAPEPRLVRLRDAGETRESAGVRLRPEGNADPSHQGPAVLALDSQLPARLRPRPAGGGTGPAQDRFQPFGWRYL